MKMPLSVPASMEIWTAAGARSKSKCRLAPSPLYRPNITWGRFDRAWFRAEFSALRAGVQKVKVLVDLMEAEVVGGRPAVELVVGCFIG